MITKYPAVSKSASDPTSPLAFRNKNFSLPLLVLIGCLALSNARVAAQELDFTATRAEVNFGKELQPWDGFGFNYVETAQTMDYDKDPQEYGGFSLLKEEDRQKAISMVFGEDGLKVGVVKMFYDPFHQKEPGGKFDHERTTKQMRYFAREGLKKTRAAGRDLTIITTLYGPPGWMTKQKAMRGRDLDPARKADLVNYLVDWVKYLREIEGLPVKYVSLHNEGEDWFRWNQAGLTETPRHDYNMFWPPEQVVEFIKLVAAGLKAAGLDDVGVTPGENTNWYRWGTWGYADAIVDDPEALQKLGIITSHGFYGGTYGRWFGEHKSAGIDLLRAARPTLHAWVTSTSWSAMDAKNIKEHHGNIYTAKVNGIIPWAGIQRPTKWVGGDPNPGSALTVQEDGTFEVRRGYYMYKQVTRAGQPGMVVVRTSAMDSEIALIGFGASATKNPDAFVLINIGNHKKVAVSIKGSSATTFAAYRTTDDSKDQYASVGEFKVQNGVIVYDSPKGSVTTFFGARN